MVYRGSHHYTRPNGKSAFGDQYKCLVQGCNAERIIETHSSVLEKILFHPVANKELQAA